MDKEPILWNDLIKITPKEYFKKYGYLFDKDEYLSDKLKKYNLNSALTDSKNDSELMQYHTFVARAREFITNNITVYKLTNELIDVVQNLSLEGMADEPPVGFKNPLIIESNEPKTNLFGDINSIVYYYGQLIGKDIEEMKANYMMTILFHIQQQENDNYYKKAFELNEFTQKKRITHLYAGSNLFCLMQPYDFRWGFNCIDYKRDVLANNNFCERCASKNKCEGVQKTVTKKDYIWCQKGLLDNFFSFAFRFLYLLEAENSPILADRKTEHTSHVTNKKGKIIETKQDWYMKYLYLMKPKTEYEKSSTHSELDRNGLIIKDVRVKGHYRYQACGPGHKEHKLILIHPYLSTRSVKDKDTKIITGLAKNK
jgi:hypothetical protein